jgi:hypothetical protein
MLMLETTIKTFLPMEAAAVTSETWCANIVTTVTPTNNYYWWTNTMTYEFMFYKATNPNHYHSYCRVIFPMFTRRRPLLAMQECEQVLLASQLGVGVNPQQSSNTISLVTTQPKPPFDIAEIIAAESTGVCRLFGISIANFSVELYSSVLHAFVQKSPNFLTSNIISFTGHVDSGIFGLPLAASTEGILGVTTDQVYFYTMVLTLSTLSAKVLFPFFDFQFQTISFFYGNMDVASMKMIEADLSSGTNLEGYQPENRVHFRVSGTFDLRQIPSFETTLSRICPSASSMLTINGNFFFANDSTSFPADASSFSGFCVSGLLDLSSSPGEPSSGSLQFQQVGVTISSVQVLDFSQDPSPSPNSMYAVDVFGNLQVLFDGINLTIAITASFNLNSSTNTGGSVLTVGGYLENWKNAFGIQGLVLTSLRVSFQIDPSDPAWNTTAIDMSAVLKVCGQELEVGGNLGSDICGAVIQLEDVSLDFMTSLMTSLVSSLDDLPDADDSALSTFSMKNVTLSISNAEGSIGSFSVIDGFVMTGEVSIYGHTAATGQLQISSEGFQLTGSITQFSPAFNGIDITDASLNLSYRTSSDPQGKGISFYINAKVTVGPMQNVEGQLVYDSLGGWLFYAHVASSSSLGSLFHPLEAIPMLSSSVPLDSALMLASGNGILVPTNFSILPFESVSEGANLAVKLASLTQLSTLCKQQSSPCVVMVISLQPNSFEAFFQLNGSVDLGHGITTQPFQAGVTMSDEQCILFVKFGIIVPVPKNANLTFSLELNVTEVSADATASMEGMWQDAFGVSGLSIGNVQLEVGIDYSTFLELGPSLLGLQGVITYGTDFSVTLKGVYGINPEDLSLVGSFVGNLTLAQIADILLGVCHFSLSTQQIPQIDFQDVEFSMSSLGGTVGDITYPPGFSFSARLLLFSGCTISILVLLSPDGFHGKESIGDLQLGPVLIENCVVDVQLLKVNVGIAASGNFQLFGSSISAQVQLSPEEFFLSCQILLGRVDEMDFNLSISGKFQLSSTDIELMVGISDEAFFSWIIGVVKGEIADGFKNLKSQVQTALQQCDAAENTFNTDLSNAQTAIEKSEAEAIGKLQGARTKLETAQRKWSELQKKVTSSLPSQKANIASLQEKLDHDKRSLQSAKDLANRQIGDAQSVVSRDQKNLNDVTKKQNTAVASAQHTVDSLNHQISSIESEIHHLEREAKRDPFKWSYIGPEIAAKKSEQGTLYVSLKTADGVLSAAKTTCDGAIDAAKGAVDAATKSLEEITKAQDSLVSAAQDVVTAGKSALSAAETAESSALKSMTAATGTLNTAIGAVTDAQTALKKVMEAGAQTMKAVRTGTDAVAFQTAKESLKTAQQTLEDAIDAANSVLGSLSIDSISGTAQYSSSKSNSNLQLTVSGSFGPSPFNFTVQLDLSTPPASLASGLLNDIVANIKSLLPVK